MENIGDLPLTPVGASGLLVLTGIIIWLLRVGVLDRRAYGDRLKQVIADHAAALAAEREAAANTLAKEREDRKQEREWITAFFEHRIAEKTQQCDEERKRRIEAEERLRQRSVRRAAGQ